MPAIFYGRRGLAEATLRLSRHNPHADFCIICAVLVFVQCASDRTGKREGKRGCELKVPVSKHGRGKAPEDWRTPKPVGYSCVPISREASWSAAVLSAPYTQFIWLDNGCLIRQ